MWQNSKTQNSTKLEKKYDKTQTQNVTKFKNLKCEKIKKKIWMLQNSKTQNVREKNLNNKIVAKLKKTSNVTNSKTKIFI